jgi:DnaD/phage-associated family protein
MGQFKGFSTGKKPGTSLPESFFTELLPEIEDVEELKVLLLIFWKTSTQEGPFPFVKKSDLLAGWENMGRFEKQRELGTQTLEAALEAAIRRGALLSTVIDLKDREESIYLLNSARGRAAMEAVREGKWDPGAEDPTEASKTSPPNIFKIYEENIGPLTPMIAEALKEAEQLYPAPWIEEAIRIAVENNVRRWRYAEAILQNWHEKGKDERKVRGDTEKDRRRYVRGEFSEFVEH